MLFSPLATFITAGPIKSPLFINFGSGNHVKIYIKPIILFYYMRSRGWYRGFLTKKEHEVYRLQKKGYSQNEIVQRLGISQPQVSQIISTIDEKVKRSKETIEIIEGDRITPLRKKRSKDEVEVFSKIVRERVKKNVRYGKDVVEIEPW